VGAAGSPWPTGRTTILAHPKFGYFFTNKLGNKWNFFSSVTSTNFSPFFISPKFRYEENWGEGLIRTVIKYLSPRG